MTVQAITTPKVSVITSCHNTVDYVAQCVQSVRDVVTCGKFTVEHICCDDGSTDGTTNLLHSLACDPTGNDDYSTADYHGLKVVAYSQNTKKPSIVRNRAISRATGKYIFCLDDDDVLIQNSLRYMVEYLETHPSARWVYGDFMRVGKNLEYVTGHDYYGWPHATPNDLLYSVFKGDHFYQHSLLFQRSLFDEVGQYDPTIRIGEDLDLCVRFVLAGHMPTHLPINTHLHRHHGRNMTAEFGRAEHLADVRSHYYKHKEALAMILTPAQIEEIDHILGLSSRTNGVLLVK